MRLKFVRRILPMNHCCGDEGWSSACRFASVPASLIQLFVELTPRHGNLRASNHGLEQHSRLESLTKGAARHNAARKTAGGVAPHHRKRRLRLCWRQLALGTRGGLESTQARDHMF